MLDTRHTINQSLNVTCADCLMTFRTENVTPYAVATVKHYCVACGSSNTKISSDDEDMRWDALVRNFGLPNRASSIELIKGLYELWDINEYPSFKEFVAKSIKEL